MKLMRQMPLPEKLKRNRGLTAKWKALVEAMEYGDAYNFCTASEKEVLYRTLRGLGFYSVTRKMNGHFCVWKLKRPKRPTIVYK